MKMRGYSVLFVCALCVFVLCGAAAVVFAQEVTPEMEAAEAAKADADAAKTKGDEALGIYKEFESNVSSVVSTLTLAIGNISVSKTKAKKIKEEILNNYNDVILKEIDGLKTKAEAAKTAVEKLAGAEAAIFRDEKTRTALTNIIKEVELNMTEVQKAAAAVTDDISGTDVVIEKAGALETAAKKAVDKWFDAMVDLEAEVYKVTTAIIYVDTAKEDTEGFLNVFDGSSDPEAQKVKKELSDAVENMLKPSLKKLTFLRDATQNATDAAREASNNYDALAKKAGGLKQAAKDKKQKVQKGPQKGGKVSSIHLSPSASA